MTVVLDASAMLAFILSEDGADFIAERLAAAHVSAVNVSESIAKLMEYGLSADQAVRQIERLELDIRDFDLEQAERTARLRQLTRQLGLSLGDRACLALGTRLALPVLTSDRRMAEANGILGLDIRLIR